MVKYLLILLTCSSFLYLNATKVAGPEFFKHRADDPGTIEQDLAQNRNEFSAPTIAVRHGSSVSLQQTVAQHIHQGTSQAIADFQKQVESLQDPQKSDLEAKIKRLQDILARDKSLRRLL